MADARQLASELNKMLGGEVLQLGTDPQFKVEYIPTGLLPIDIVLGGGLPRGRSVEITGAYSTLKSYIGLNAIAQVQRAGGTALLVDNEHTFDPDWAREIGVKTRDLLLEWPETGELAMDVMDTLVRNGVDLIVFDSVAAALPQAEASKRLYKENVQPARLAAMMSVALRKITTANRRTALLWINQLREQVGVTFGPTEKSPGGRALGYYASIRMNIRMAGKITRDDKAFTGEKYQATKVQIGQTFRAMVEKSKLNAPYTEVFFDFDLRIGRLNLVKFLFTQGVDLGLIVQKGQTWEIPNLGHPHWRVRGKDACLRALEVDEIMQERLEEEIRQRRHLPDLPGVFVRPSRSAAKKNGKSSKRAALDLIQTQEQDESSVTAATKIISTKSKRLQRPTR